MDIYVPTAMTSQTKSRLGDETQLVFGAGFAFGVTCALLLIAVLLASVGNSASLGSPVMLTTGAGVLFAGVVGAALYLLAFPENRTLIPVSTEEDEGVSIETDGES